MEMFGKFPVFLGVMCGPEPQKNAKIKRETQKSSFLAQVSRSKHVATAGLDWMGGWLGKGREGERRGEEGWDGRSIVYQDS